MRIRYVSTQMPGWTRRRRGKGFEYRDERGRLLRGEQRQRCADLVIPPAWTDVWICPLPHGHLQATGTDAAGRRQYLYHPVWRAQREQEKFEAALVMAARLPRARRRVRKHIGLRGMPRERALAVAFSLLDFGLFRIGSPRYEELHGTYGLSTLLVKQVTVTGTEAHFEYPGKSHVEQEISVTHQPLVRALRSLTRDRDPDAPLLHFRENDTARNLTGTQINDYLTSLLGPDATAKNFRTWHATVYAACALAVRKVSSKAEREDAVREVVAKTAELLGNTPAVARSSYIDSHIIDGYLNGMTIPLQQKSMPPGPPFPPRAESAVLEFLS